MSRKTAKNAKEHEIKKTEQYLESLEWKQAVLAIGIGVLEYVKHETKSALVQVDGSEQRTNVAACIDVLLGISKRVGGDYVQNSHKLRALYGIKPTPQEKPEDQLTPEEEALAAAELDQTLKADVVEK